MKINKIKKLSNNRYKIELDNDSIILYEDVIIDNNILYKKEIDEDLLKKINKENIYDEAYNKTLKYVMTKMRSINEVEIYLNKMEISYTNKKSIIKKLKNINLLNDQLYAEAYISDKINLTSDGPFKIKKYLLSQKIDSSIIDSIIEQYDDSIFEEKIIKIIKKKKNIKYSDYIFKQKLLVYLTNLGYSKEQVIPVLNTINTDNSDIIKKEYNILYTKLAKKYEEPKLSYEIKNRLYKKGFSLDDINNIKE